MVNKKAGADGRAGVNVYPGDAVGVLGDDARNQPYAFLVQVVRQPLQRNGRNARVAQQRLNRADGGGVAFVGGVYVANQQALNVRQGADKIAGDFVRLGFAAGAIGFFLAHKAKRF